MQIDRRQMLAGLSGLALSGVPSMSLARSAMQLGEGAVIALSDGNLVLPASFFFEGLPEDELDLILARHNVPRDELTPPCNLTLLRQPGRTVLFDAGAGPAFMPSTGKLLDSLEAEGLAPDDITHVVFTHAHPDHLWGVLDDFDDPVFGSAELMIGQAEWDYWTDPDTVDTIDEGRASFAVGAARRLSAIEDQVTFFKGGDEILPGVMAHSTPGHTPGHMSFEIRDGTSAVMVIGDAIGNDHVAFERPGWAIGSDQDTDLGAQTRVRLLDQLATDDIAIIGFHLSHGGLGRVERAGDNYRFVAKDA
ncbi:MBL fold metallo-hydrolase [Pelagivirga sediminicola]|uniref:MBL fold metallo-hydrolase n=1 Tax=Pelagivirga sediminicola TaxID=2170575 RepID=A0A2T7G8H6_9RHOB|nr:MBL fold metallo-hydrolase [Pelagivirga sediminicola]PVA10714.1 MBL fold metallo-hydrolase [Pelagivirga sediminicola]